LEFGSWNLGFGILDFGSSKTVHHKSSPVRTLLEYGSWNLGFGIWDLEFGIWVLELGIWILDLGSWNLKRRLPQKSDN
jgi:hypothetical protein